MKIWVSTVFFAICLALVIYLPVGCSQSVRVERFRSWAKPNGKIKILSTIVQIGDVVREIGGDRIDSLVLIEGELDPHSYELVKGDDEKFSIADAVFYNGLGLEHGASLHTALERHPGGVSIGASVQKSRPEKILQRNQLTDPHIWMDLSLWKEGVFPTMEKLIALDPEGETFYRARANLLFEKMEKQDIQMRELIHRVPSSRRYLVTSHDAFHYFARAYLADAQDGDNWKERFAAPEGLSPDGQLSPADLQGIIRYLQSKQIEVIFPESNVSRDSIRKIVSAGQELGLHITICPEALYGDAMGTDEGKSYLDSMLHNAEVISRCLWKK